MGSMPSLINSAIEARANALMATDFLCPEASRRWARFHLAVAHWHRRDPGKNSQGFLARHLGVDPSLLTQARNPPEDPTSASNGLAEEKHGILAGILGVDPEWLVSGFSADGRTCWPAWTELWTAPSQEFLTRCFDAYVVRLAQGLTAPGAIVAIVGEPTGRADDRLDLIEPVMGGIDAAADSEARTVIVHGLVRHQLTLSAYLGRFRSLLHDHWVATVQRALCGPEPDIQVFGAGDASSTVPSLILRSYIQRRRAELGLLAIT